MARTSSTSHHAKFPRVERKLRKPMARNAANARERSRMRILSRAFSLLKKALPWVPHDTKLSKLDTLRLACSYIAYLHHLLTAAENTSHQKTATSLEQQYPNMNWPFCVKQLQSQRQQDEERRKDAKDGEEAGTTDWSSSCGDTIAVQEILY